MTTAEMIAVANLDLPGRMVAKICRTRDEYGHLIDEFESVANEALWSGALWAARRGLRGRKARSYVGCVIHMAFMTAIRAWYGRGKPKKQELAFDPPARELPPDTQASHREEAPTLTLPKPSGVRQPAEAEAIMAMIRDRPELDNAEISRALRRRGIHAAKETVAKWRERTGVPNPHRRRFQPA